MWFIHFFAWSCSGSPQGRQREVRRGILYLTIGNETLETHLLSRKNI
ncbi:MAG: hypothetical protein ABSG48_10410 [Geobacteraceae bacterium]